MQAEARNAVLDMATALIVAENYCLPNPVASNNASNRITTRELVTVTIPERDSHDPERIEEPVDFVCIAGFFIFGTGHSKDMRA